MTRIIYDILRAVVLILLYTSTYSDDIRLYAEFKPIVGRPFKLVCNTGVNITSTVTIKFPDGNIAGTCDPAAPPVPVDCSSAANYDSALDETENTVTINTNSLASNVNGTWKCTYIADAASYNVTTPIREIRDENFTLFPRSFTENITSETASISLSATYGCINLPVYFKWFVVDSASNKTDIEGTSNAAEDGSVCTSLSGFNGYTETKEINEDVYSSNSVKYLNGSYRLGVEVHYMDEGTTLHSIKYFDTYFVFSSGGTSTSTKKYGIALAILSVCLLVADFIVVAVRFCTGSTVNTFEEKFFDCCGRILRQKNWALGFMYLVLYGVIVGVIVLLVVYYGIAKFQEGLVIGVGFVIVFALSCLCLVVVWMLMKFVNNGASRSLSCILNGTVTPQDKGKSQKKATVDKRQQPDGDEGPQSTPKDPDARHLTTGRPLPRRPDIASPQTGSFNSVNSPRPNVLAPIENPNILPSIDTLDEQKTDKKPKDKKKKKKKKDEEQDNPADVQDNNVLT